MKTKRKTIEMETIIEKIDDGVLLVKLEEMSIPCVKDEGIDIGKHEKDYVKNTVRVQLSYMQMTDMMKQWGVDVKEMTRQASIHDLSSDIAKEYCRKIRSMAEQNSNEQQCRLSIDNGYNLAYMFEKLDFDTNEEKDKPKRKAIYVSVNSKFVHKAILDGSMTEISKDEDYGKYIRYNGICNGVPVYTMLDTKGTDDLLIICNDVDAGCVLHYAEGALRHELIPNEVGDAFGSEVSFVSALMTNEDSYKHFYMF